MPLIKLIISFISSQSVGTKSIRFEVAELKASLHNLQPLYHDAFQTLTKRPIARLKYQK